MDKLKTLFILIAWRASRQDERGIKYSLIHYAVGRVMLYIFIAEIFAHDINWYIAARCIYRIYPAVFYSQAAASLSIWHVEDYRK